MATLSELTAGNEVLTSFVYNTLIINKLEDIISKLEAGYYTDTKTSVKFLLNERKNFANLALQTLNINIKFPSSKDYTSLTPYVKETLLSHFKSLLKYFSSIK